MSLTDIKNQLDNATDEAEEAGNVAKEKAIARDELRDKYDEARVADMDETVVKEAQELGINPKNFETTEHLQEAIDLQKKNAEEE